jgi:ankyrin repeat protein
VSYFFAARRRSPEGSTLLGFLHALFHQILQQDEDIMSEFLPLFRSKRDRYGPAFDWQTEELVNFITTFLLVHPSNRPILLFVDGLDECQDRDRNDLITFLCSLATPNMQVRICISARHYPLLPLPKCPHVVVEDYNSTAIALFVNLKLSLTGFKFQKRELVNAIVTKANGAFYWTSLMVEKLNKEEEEGKSFEELFHTIESVPAELDGMFSTLFQDLTAREKQESLTLIRWVLLPKDPLTLTELRYAVAFSSDCWSLEISLPTWRGSRHFMDNDRFVRWIHTHSRGLIEVVADFQTKYLSDMFVRYGSNGASKLDINAVERENFPGHWSAVEDKYYTNQRVQFVHESARQFFLEGNGLKILSPSSTIDNIGQAHSCMAEACLRMFGISELEPLDNGVTPLPKEEQYYPFGSSEKATAYYDDRVKETNSWCQDPNGLKKWLLKQSLPFLDYATSNFTLHSKLANQEDGISETLHSALVGYRRNRFRRWTLLQDDYLVSDDTTPLYWACENQLTSYVDALLDQGVDPNQKGGKNCYPLLIAAKTSKEPGLIMKLLKHGADINVTTTSGDTALHLAVIADHALLIPVLCEQGIRIEVRDDNGKTPLLDCALFSEDVDVYRALLAQGANPDAKDYKDNTIVHWSTQAIDDAKLWCQFFINLRPQYLEARNTDQKTPLHLAAMSDQGAVEALLEAGAGPGVRDTHNKTPLHYAAELKDCESMKRLLEAGASIDAMDDAGKTPLHLSVGGDEQKQRILQATRFLVEAGADVTLLDHEGHTAEEVATITGNADTAAFLDSGSWPADMQCYNERYNEHQAIQLPQESDSDEDETHKQRKYVIVPGHGMEDFRRMAADLGFKIENGKFVRQNDSEGS